MKREQRRSQQMEKSVITDILLCSLAIIAAVPLIGVIVDAVVGRILRIIFGAIDRTGTFFVIFNNFLTIPGVIIHEFAHFIIAAITGAKVIKADFYKFTAGSLGSVSFRPRGPLLLRSLQQSCTACAPVILGLIAETGFYLLLAGGTLVSWQIALIVYLMICVGLHMDMSMADIMVYIKGIPGTFLIVCALVTAGYYSGMPALIH